MASSKHSTKRLIVLGLFVFAFVWVMLMWVLDARSGAPREVVSVGGGGSSGAGAKLSKTVRDDGTIKTEITRFTRDRTHVSMNVNVTDKDGKVVTDLKPNEEFKVYENGEQVKIKEFTPASQSGGIRVAIVADYGPHSGKAERELTQAGIENVLKALKEESDQFGLYLNNHFYLATGKRESVPMGPVNQARRDQAVKAMDNILQFYSGGGLLKTMGIALSKLAETRGRRILVVITDGFDDFHDVQIAQAPTKDLRAKYQDDHKKIISDIVGSAKDKWNIPIYMLNPKTGGREDVCKEMADKTGGEYHICPTTGKLTDTLVRITEKVRNDYMVEYDSPNTKLDGNERKVTIVIKSDNSTSLTDKDYRVEGAVSLGGESEPKQEASSSSGGFKKAAVGTFKVLFQFLALALLLCLLFAAPYFLWLGGSTRTEQTAASPAPAAAVPTAQPVAAPDPRMAQAAKQLAAQKAAHAAGSNPPVQVPAKSSQGVVVPAKSSQGVVVPAKSSQGVVVPAKSSQGVSIPKRGSSQGAIPPNSKNTPQSGGPDAKLY